MTSPNKDIARFLAALDQTEGLATQEPLIVGGVAVSLVAPVVTFRLPDGRWREWYASGTKDVDLLVPHDRLASLDLALVQAGWSRRPSDGVQRYRRDPTLLDCVLADPVEDPFRHAFFERVSAAAGAALEGRRVASPAALVAMKAVAFTDNSSREKDLEDLARIALVFVDDPGISQRLREFVDGSSWLEVRLERVRRMFESPDARGCRVVVRAALNSSFIDDLYSEWEEAISAQVFEAVDRLLSSP